MREFNTVELRRFLKSTTPPCRTYFDCGSNLAALRRGWSIVGFLGEDITRVVRKLQFLNNFLLEYYCFLWKNKIK
jgi:hypothetical protein